MKKKSFSLHGNHVVCYYDQPWMSNFEKLRKRGSGFKSLLLLKLLEENLKWHDCLKSCGKHSGCWENQTRHVVQTRRLRGTADMSVFPSRFSCLTRGVFIWTSLRFRYRIVTASIGLCVCDDFVFPKPQHCSHVTDEETERGKLPRLILVHMTAPYRSRVLS